MNSEDIIIGKLKIIDQANFERLIDNLLYCGAFADVCPQNSFIEPFGVNPEKNRTIKSPSHADAEIVFQGAVIEKSVRENWEDKFKEDVAKNKKHRRFVKKFVFCTNQDTGSKSIKFGRKKVDAVKYCKNELNCKECYIIGQRELLQPLQTPNFFFLRRSYLGIEEDFFRNPTDYLRIIRSNGAMPCDLAEDTLEKFAKDIDRELSFQPSSVVVLHNDDYIPLIHSLGLWAFQKKEESSKSILERDYSFIKWPQDLSGTGISDINQTIENFVMVWGANNIKDLSGYLRFANEKTTLVFVCPSAFKEEVIEKIRLFNKNINVQVISIETIDKRISSTKEMTQHEKKVGAAIQGITDLAMRLEALIYYYSPLYLNDSKKIKKIQRLLGVGSQQLIQLVDILMNNDFAQSTGNILWLKHPSVARTLLSDFLDKGVFDIDNLV